MDVGADLSIVMVNLRKPLRQFLRPDQKFETINALKKQISNDVVHAKEVLV